MNKPDLNCEWYVQDKNIDTAIVRVLKLVKKNYFYIPIEKSALFSKNNPFKWLKHRFVIIFWKNIFAYFFDWFLPEIILNIGNLRTRYYILRSLNIFSEMPVLFY